MDQRVILNQLSSLFTHASNISNEDYIDLYNDIHNFHNGVIKQSKIFDDAFMDMDAS